MESNDYDDVDCVESCVVQADGTKMLLEEADEQQQQQQVTKEDMSVESVASVENGHTKNGDNISQTIDVFENHVAVVNMGQDSEVEVDGDMVVSVPVAEAVESTTVLLRIDDEQNELEPEDVVDPSVDAAISISQRDEETEIEKEATECDIGLEEETTADGTQILVVVPGSKNDDIEEESIIEDITPVNHLHHDMDTEENNITIINPEKFSRRSRRGFQITDSHEEDGIEVGRTRKRRLGKGASEKSDIGARKVGRRPMSTSVNSKIEKEEEQCRICLSRKTLVSIFHSDEDPDIAEKIMSICTTVKVVEKDFLPQQICITCLESLNVALNFKALCEKTDKDLRSKLTRGKNKVRRPKEFVMIDCDGLSDDSNEGIRKDDEEFHLSHESVESDFATDSDSSFELGKRKSRRSTRRKRKFTTPKRKVGRPPNPKRGRPSLAEKRTPKITNNVVYLNDEEMTSDEENTPLKKRRSKLKSENLEEEDSEVKKEFQCVYCKNYFASALILRDHKRTHAGEKPFICNICNRAFKLLGSYDKHLQRHKDEDALMCSKCEKHFNTKTEHRRHMIDEHGEPIATYICDKCKKAFTTLPRLNRHKEGKCPGYEVPIKKQKPEIDNITLGRDLFKCVAPMTTTYWSDSFSD